MISNHQSFATNLVCWFTTHVVKITAQNHGTGFYWWHLLLPYAVCWHKFYNGNGHRRSSEKLALNLRINTVNNTTTTTLHPPPPKIAKKARLKLFKTRLKYKYKKNTFFIMQKIDTRYPMDKWEWAKPVMHRTDKTQTPTTHLTTLLLNASTVKWNCAVLSP